MGEFQNRNNWSVVNAEARRIALTLLLSLKRGGGHSVLNISPSEEMFALYCNFAAASNKYRSKQEITLKFQRHRVPEILFFHYPLGGVEKFRNKLRFSLFRIVCL
ncbi:hypothetical protein CEXT_130841 [Caerostris extrusa]|uniref:Uncharacterized protein n=1 Tax=Caerostris extrusa TaxID=172846 RepID=A0AAV4VHR3_CAEEX|nr:hypothetical protein CEXT_130841 [Caerostris extrusa]